MLHTHPNAHTTPATRAEIACSSELSGVVAQGYGVSPETVPKRRKQVAAAARRRAYAGARAG